MPDLTTILIAAVVFVIGLVLGFLVQSFRSDESSSAQEGGSAAGLPKGFVEVLGVWRHQKTGRMTARLEGQPLSSSRTLNRQQQARLRQVLTEFNRLVGESLSAPEPAPSSPRPAAGPAAASPPPAPVSAEDSVPGTFAATLPEQPGVRTLLTGPPILGGGTRSEAPAEAPQSIVEQINEIVQTKLADSPLAEKRIRLEETPSGGMLVCVGTERFETIDEVADPSVRALLKQSVAEWNQKMGHHR